MVSITRRHSVAALVALLVVAVLAVATVRWATRQPKTGGGARAPLTSTSAADCLARGNVLRLTGERTRNYWDRRPTDDKTYDFRGLVSKAYGKDFPAFPVSVGIRDVIADAPGSPLTMDNDPGARACVLGGAVLGQMPRSLTWGDVKRGSNNRYDGDALQMQSDGWSVVNGFRADNVEDGIAPYGLYNDKMYVRNVYESYVRDDCIENDWPVISMVVEDSLFDGCFMGISERPDPDVDSTPPPSSSVTYDGVLMRIQPMPHGEGELENGQLFKIGPHANKFVIRNSVFLVEKVALNGVKPMRFPRRAVVENVTLVWTGRGKYPGEVPSGVRVTKDRSVWTNARADWLKRHGCPSRGDRTGTSCKNMIPELNGS